MLLKEVNPDMPEITEHILKHFVPVPLCFQENAYSCGVACVQSILACYGIIYRQDVLSEMLNQKPLLGTDYQAIINFMEMLGFQASLAIDMNIDLIKTLIDSRTAPVLMLQAWKEDSVDYSFDWRDSHYTIACGYDEDRIIFMDPWTLAYYTYISNAELLKRWHGIDQTGNHYYHTGLIIKNDNLPMIYNPCNIIRQE